MSHLVDRENTVVFGTVAAILLSVIWSQRVRKTEQEYLHRVRRSPNTSLPSVLTRKLLDQGPRVSPRRHPS